MDRQMHLWVEDKEGKASFLFWNALAKELFPAIIVESKKNNSELVKAVKNIEDNDWYFIALDNSFDNPDVYREQNKLKEYSKGKNVIQLDFICFEYLLLEFNRLLDWIYAEEDEFRDIRATAIAARNALIKILSDGELDYKQTSEIMKYDVNLGDRNIEQLSAKLLYDLTRNTGFEVTKRKIGDCWIRPCCSWETRQEDDICGLDKVRLRLDEKMKAIYDGTSIKKEFRKAGLEAEF